MVSNPFKPGCGVIVIATGETGYISAIKRPDFAKRFGVTVQNEAVRFFGVDELRLLRITAKKNLIAGGSKHCKFSPIQTAHIKSMSGRFGSESEYLRHLVEADMEESIAE